MSIDNNIDFKDHIVQYPNRFKQTTVAPGIVELVPTWITNPEEIIEPGTPVDSELFKKLKQNVSIYQQTFTTTDNQTVINLERDFLIGQNRVSLSIGGVRQYAGQDYAETDSHTLTMTVPLKGGLKAEVIMFTASQSIAEDFFEKTVAAIAATQAANDAAQDALEAATEANNSTLNWRAPVDMFSQLASVSNPKIRDTIMVRNTGKVFRYNGTTWLEIQDIDPAVINEVDTRTNKKIDDISQKTALNNFYDTTKATLILAGIDSLTNGAGGTKYLDYFAPRMRGEMGDGGPGYVPLDYGYSVEEGYSFGASGGFVALSLLPKDDPDVLRSFDLKGYRTVGATNGAMDYDIKRKYKKCTLFYLKKPGGGSFKVGYLSDYASVNFTIDTNSVSYSLGVFDMPDNTDSRQGKIAIRQAVGDVCLFGLLCLNDTGVAISRIGKGGDRLKWHSDLDATFRTAWIEALKPKMYLFNGGANDSNFATADEFSNYLNNYLGGFITYGTQIVLIRPNSISGNTMIDQYEQKLLNFRKQNKTDMVFNNRLLGEKYETANADGYMLDGVHPSDLGNRKIANNLLSYLSLPVIGQNITLLNIGGSVALTKQYTATLSTKSMNVASGSKTNFYKLGLVAAYPIAILKLRVSGTRNGTNNTLVKECNVIFNNGTTINNNVSAVLKTSVFEIVSFTSSGQPTVAFDVDFVVNNGKLEINIGPASGYNFAMDFTVVGDATFTYLGSTGQSLFEN